ncbi:MAG TPA: CarD family transcriptional regulator, partial [Opitutaceae bacterium]
MRVTAMSTLTTLSRTKLTGICPPARGAVLGELVRRQQAPVWLVVTAELKAAEQLAEDVAFFTEVANLRPGPEILVFPESMPDSRDMREAFAASADRATVLSKLRATRQASATDTGAPPVIVATTPAALLQPVPALEEFATREFTLARGNAISFPALLEKLRELDYDSEAVCEAPGHYAIRGGIIDVYPVTANQPYRLDFFGDELEEIRPFDPVTQRSGEKIDSITIAASPRLKLDPSKTGLADYLSPHTHLVFIEPASLDEEFSTFAREGSDPLTPILQRCAAATGIADIDEAAALFDGEDVAESTWDTESLAHHRRYPGEALVAQERLDVEEESRREFLVQVAAWKKAGYRVLFVVSKEGEEQRIREILDEDPALKKIAPAFLRGVLNEGFRITNRGRSALALASDSSTRKRAPTSADPTGLVVVTETELFGRQRLRRPQASKRALAQRAQVDQLLDFSELVEGDFVVHLQHGIALYRGLTKLETRDGVREVISLEFDDHVT